MNEKPIIFNTEMIKAILEGRKTQTRRVIKLNLINPKWTGSRWAECGNDNTFHFEIKCPYGRIGDHLWVRETFATTKYKDHVRPSSIPHYATPYYKATQVPDIHIGKWRPSIFMPRTASRILLEIIDIYITQVQNINEYDAMKEGDPKQGLIASENTHVDWFIKLWNSINEKRGYSWDTNPHVWVVEFKISKVR